MSARIPQPTLRGKTLPGRTGDIERWCQEVAALIDRYPVEAVIQIGAETANVRRYTITVKDRRLRETVGPWVVHVWISDAATLVPGGTQVVTFPTGTVLDTLVADERFRVLTNAAGVIEMDVEVSGSGNRYVVAIVEPAPQSSGPTSWA